MASCALRGFRYIAFPPIVFEAPKRAAEPVAEPVVEAAPTPEAHLPEVPAPPPPPTTPPATTPPETTPSGPIALQPPEPAPPSVAEPAPRHAPPEPMAPEASRPIGPAMRRLTEFADLAAEPQAPPLRARRLAELSDAESLEASNEGSAPRRFALLNDIAVELRPRRVRARTGRRA